MEVKYEGSSIAPAVLFCGEMYKGQYVRENTMVMPVMINDADRDMVSAFCSVKVRKIRGLLPGSLNWCSSPFCRYFSAIASISQSTPLGSAFTATQLRAGLEVKYLA
jgi:hypothetical protein